MIRPVTLVCALMAAGSGLYLYQTKHQAQLLDRQIHKVREATDATLTRAGMLRAEYALLNDPDRLAGLAAEYLPDLRPTLPQQWTSMNELDRRLPPVGAPEQEPTPLEQADPAAAPMARIEPAALPATARPAPIVVATPARPPAAAPALAPAGAPRPAPVAVARAVPRPPIAARVPQAQVAAVVVHPLPAPPASQVQVAHSNGGPPSRGAVVTSLAPIASQPVQVYAAAARPVEPSAPVVGSALAMARTMMSFSPVSPANAATPYQPGVSR